jgi:hypothetical protein
VLAAGNLGDPRLHEPLAALTAWWDVDEELLAWAVERTDPATRPPAAALERELLRRVADRLGDRAELDQAGVELLGVELEGAYPRTALLLRWRAAGEPDGSEVERVPLWGGTYALLAEAREDPDRLARLVAALLGLEEQPGLAPGDGAGDGRP